MKKLSWVIISMAFAVMGCATPPTMPGHDPVYLAAADTVVATRGQNATAKTPDDVNSHLNSSVVRTLLDNEFDLIASHTLRPEPQGTPIDFGLKWKGVNEAAFGIGLRTQNRPGSDRRWVLAPKLALNPDLQLLKNPAFKSDHAQLREFGISVQVALQYNY